MLKKVALTIIIIGSVLLLTAALCFARTSKKPLPPLRISITPVQAGLTPDQIKPGDTVAFTVAAVSAIDSPEMNITVDLVGGATLVSGDTTWSGPAAKNEEKSIVFTVQVPKTGKGRVRARVTLPSRDGAHFSSQAQFELGSRSVAKPGQAPAIKKDSKGRNIIEYR